MSNKLDWQNLFYELLERVEYIDNTYDAVVTTRKFSELAGELELSD